MNHEISDEITNLITNDWTRDVHHLLLDGSYDDAIELVLTNSNLDLFKAIVNEFADVIDIERFKLECAEDRRKYFEFRYLMDIKPWGSDYNHLAYLATRNSNPTVVKDMIRMGANDWYNIALGVAESGQWEILNTVLSKTDFSISELNDIAVHAVEYDNLIIVRMLINLGANDYNGMAIAAARRCETGTVHDFIEMGANNFDEIAISAAEVGYRFVVLMMIYEHDITNYNTIAAVAQRNGHQAIVNEIVRRGAGGSN